MKNLITTIAALIIFSICMTQFVSEEGRFNKIILSERLVDRYATEAETVIDEKNLKEDLANLLSCNRNEISISKTSETERTVTYDISYPIYHVLGSAKTFGVSEEENKIIHQTEAVVRKKTQIKEKEEDKPKDDPVTPSNNPSDKDKEETGDKEDNKEIEEIASPTDDKLNDNLIDREEFLEKVDLMIAESLDPEKTVISETSG